MSNKVKIVSTTVVGNDKAVRIAVPTYQSLLNYKPGTDEITIVEASESCPEDDLKAIESYCQLLNYSNESRQNVEDVNSTGDSSSSSSSSTGTTNDGGGNSATESITNDNDGGSTSTTKNENK